jgi:flagellar biosynthesis/type III secretory pathway protein FliH
MNSSESAARRLDGASISHGPGRRLGEHAAPSHPTDTELDHQLGFDLGYRDGMARATHEATASAEEARLAWQAEAQTTLDEAIAALGRERETLQTVADAWRARLDDDRAWAETLVVQATYAAVVRFFGERHTADDLIGPLCAETLRQLPDRALRLRVSPNDVDAVRSCVGDTLVEADERLIPCACEVDTPRGRTVAGIAERMDILRDGLLHLLATRADGDASV